MCIPKLADINLIKREIEVIEELLELEPDSKCECHLWTMFSAPCGGSLQCDVCLEARCLKMLIFLTVLTGCLDSLVYYNKVLMSLSNDDAKRAESKKACLQHLSKLQRVDGLRVNRYKQLANELASI